MATVTAGRGLATLKEGARSASSARSAEGFLAEAVDQLGRLVDSELCSILLLEGDRLYHAAATGLPREYLIAIDGFEIGPEAGSCGTAAFSGETCISEDIEIDPRWEGFRQVARDAGLRACLSVPLKLPDGAVLGTFATYAGEPLRPEPEQVEMVEAHASIVALGLDNVHHKAELAASYEAAVLALTSALDVRDDYTGSHSTATSHLVREVCARLGLPAREVEVIARVAALHDVGKLGVPTEILSSSEPLTAEQARVMRDHPVIGEQILRQIPGMEEVAKAVRHEHERWDGCGYPDGLAGERIPLASRIVFACDAYHAMVSDRPYRRALGHAAAVAELRANAGSQFDPEVVAALLGVLGDGAVVLDPPGEIEERHRREALERIAAELGAEDVFVFRKVARDTFSHLAGAGRGEGWAGNIEVSGENSRFAPLLETGRTARLAEPDAVQIVGPYYARSALIVPCRHDVIVVFGSSTESLRGADERESMALAERVARMIDQVPAAKRLADELEVLDAVRAVTTVSAEGVEAALSEIAERGATALSCEFGAVVLNRGAIPRVGWHGRGWDPAEDEASTREALVELAERVGPDSGLLIQDTADPAADPPPGFGAADGVASLHALSISDLGVLVTVHAQPSPRGFTNLCQRVARSVADGAELVIRRALAQEQLSRENASLERRASTDPLTGVANRGSWDEALMHAEIELARGAATFAVALFDLDGLKVVNDGHGHAAGDELLRSLAAILGRTARSQDLVARIGGDEFAVLLRDCDGPNARAWCERVLDAVAEHNGHAGVEQPIQVSHGVAAAGPGRGLGVALGEADRGLYGDKGA